MRRRVRVTIALLLVGAADVAAADQLVYTSLAQPCRLLDTRSPGPGKLTSAHGAYLLGSTNADIASASQHGNSSGCGVPAGVAAISVNFNMFDTSASGNILTWASGAAQPAAGTAVYNPSVATPVSGQVLYNGATATVAVGAADGRFNVSVANGQLDMTINVVGYWVPIATSASTSTLAVTVGVNNTSSGQGAIAGGVNGRANGIGSVSLGTEATLDADHSFLFSDGSAGAVDDVTANSFVAFVKGGAAFYSSATLTTGVILQPGSGSWTAVSDRNAKTAVQHINGRDVLDRVVAMPLATWQYKTQDAKYRHMGPMAQDFYAAFGLGESDTGIDTIDADGVALAAIQGLHAELLERDRQHDEDRQQIAELRAQVAELAAAIKRPAVP